MQEDESIGRFQKLMRVSMSVYEVLRLVKVFFHFYTFTVLYTKQEIDDLVMLPVLTRLQTCMNTFGMEL